jgi:predicted dehydrogenase
MGQTIQLAIVAVGAFGSRYINSLQALPGVELRWICDVNEEVCRSVVETHRLAKTKTTSDFRDACQDSSVDALIVVTPESAHRISVVTALEHGTNVIVEKPLATNEADGIAMLDVARRLGRLLMTSFLLRFEYRYARVQQRLGSIGRNTLGLANPDVNCGVWSSRTVLSLCRKLPGCQVPKTCAAITEVLPCRGTGHHGTSLEANASASGGGAASRA